MKTSWCPLILTFLFYLNSVESSSSDDFSEGSRSRSRARSFGSWRSSSSSSSPSISPERNRNALSPPQLLSLHDFINRRPYPGFIPNPGPMQQRVYPPIPLPDPPYRVVRLGKGMFYGVQIMYGTRSMRGTEISGRTLMFYPVRHALYAVKKGEKIIGYTEANLEIIPLKRLLSNGMYENVKINLQRPARRLERMDLSEFDTLGIFLKLPSNTVFDNQPRDNPDITMIKVGDEVVGSITNGVFRYEN